MLSHRATEQKEKRGFLGNIFSSPSLWLCGSVALWLTSIRNPLGDFQNSPDDFIDRHRGRINAYGVFSLSERRIGARLVAVVAPLDLFPHLFGRGYGDAPGKVVAVPSLRAGLGR